jgi:hypothetical protein
MKLMTLNAEERAQTDFTHKVNIKYTDLTAGGLTQTLNILPTGTGAFAAGFSIWKAALKLITPFTGGTIATATVTIGDAGTPARYLAAADVKTAVATNTKAYIVSATAYAYTPADIANPTTNVQALFTATSGNLNTATAGECEIYLEARDIAELVRPTANP